MMMAISSPSRAPASAAEPINVGVLTRSVPLDLASRILEETGRASERKRCLPMTQMVYFVMAMTLFMGDSYTEVLRQVLEGLRDLAGGSLPLTAAKKQSLTNARKRLGVEPLRRLYAQVVRPVATEATRGAFWRGQHLVAIDGSTLDVADSPSNRETFGLPSASRGEAAFPQLRLTSLAEVGTHILFNAQLGPCDQSEIEQARSVLTGLREGMLCLADRNFFSFEMWDLARGTRAHLLWRLKSNLMLPVYKTLPDGSYLTVLHPDQRNRTDPDKGPLVRVIDYALDGIPDTEGSYRLLTSLTDPDLHPARELAALYHERWEIETAFDEVKTHLRGRQLLLRSQRPDLVLQEAWAFLITHFAIRDFMHDAALLGDRDPDSLSFVHAVRIIRRTLPHFVRLSPLPMA